MAENADLKLYKVFVYGTLKRGHPNHHLIESDDHGLATFIGEGITVSQWPLVIATEFNIPFLLDQEGTGQRVKGELYAVNEDNLKAFDILEHHPTWYERKPLQIEILPSSASGNDAPQTEESFTYVMTNFREELLKLPLLECYDNFVGTDRAYSKEYEKLPNFMSLVKKTQG